MSLHDDIIRRWLDENAVDAAPKLEKELGDGNCETQSLKGAVDREEVKRQRARLRLVQGLLSTLDMKSAPKELNDLVEREFDRDEVVGADEGFELPLAEWVDGAVSYPILEPCKAPDLLDRLVEQRLASSQDSLQPGTAARHRQQSRSSFSIGSRRLMAGAILALLFLAAPLMLRDQGFFGTAASGEVGTLRLVNYDSLEGLQKAFPNQSQAANGMGILGAFGNSGPASGGPR
ncbi:MAG: hypothetical protein GY930_08285 [bacterium]|nr:hypothetical protein [bacterium]